MCSLILFSWSWPWHAPCNVYSFPRHAQICISYYWSFFRLASFKACLHVRKYKFSFSFQSLSLWGPTSKWQKIYKSTWGRFVLSTPSMTISYAVYVRTHSLTQWYLDVGKWRTSKRLPKRETSYWDTHCLQTYVLPALHLASHRSVAHVPHRQSLPRKRRRWASRQDYQQHGQRIARLLSSPWARLSSRRTTAIYRITFEEWLRIHRSTVRTGRVQRTTAEEGLAITCRDVQIQNARMQHVQEEAACLWARGKPFLRLHGSDC